MRGKGSFKSRRNRNRGITPAYAGKSRKWTGSQLRTWDHPRLCGEKVSSYGSYSDLLGSPPPMRGKGPCQALRHDVDGITPAYAGKSSGCCRTQSPYRDHPRLCGEKVVKKLAKMLREGSPPPMRGKVVPSTPKRKTMRITPAYAGKRLS